MSAATLAAAITAATGFITAVAALIAQLRHSNDPQAHGGQGHQP